MKNLLFYLFLIGFIFSGSNLFAQAIIADHTKAKLGPIPASAIELAKSNLHIAYAHTSHGSQLIEGMNKLRDLDLTNLVGYKGDIYNWNEGGTGGALDIDDYFVGGDLGNPDRTTWAVRTRAYLLNNSDVNVVIWSWCGQAGTASEADITIYLDSMQHLENDFPNVKFVYMTGHLDGSGVSGNLNQRNEQIRNFCKNNGKILYDFADIESYDPDGNYYLDKAANDECYYDSDGNGSRESNWAQQWQGAHTENTDWYKCSPSHTQPINGNLKAYAAWWLWARLAGWSPDNRELTAATGASLTEANLNGASVTLTLTNETFIDNTLDVSNFRLSLAPAGAGIASVTYTDETHATLVLSFDGTDFDTDYKGCFITIAAGELTGNEALSSNIFTILSETESSFNELTKENKLKLYPNPAGNHIVIDYQSIAGGSITITLHDLNGKMVMQKDYNVSDSQFETFIDTQKLSGGQYYLTLTQGKTKIAKPVIIK